MQILVDADACPVIETVEKIAKEHCVPVTLLCLSLIHISEPTRPY